MAVILDFKMAVATEAIVAQTQTKNTAEAIACRATVTILAAVVVFHAIHKPEFLTPVVTFIVGAHLIPLARLLRYSTHHVTGILLMTWATFIAMVFPGEMMPTVGALGTAAILLGSAAYALTSTGRIARMGSDRRISRVGIGVLGLGTKA